LTLQEPERDSALFRLGEVFTPSAPVDDQDLFAGRNHELFSVVEAIQSIGQHAVIYGERGVGKTSLARIAIHIARSQGAVAVRVNCDGTDDYDQLWAKVMDELEIDVAQAGPDSDTPIGIPLDECSAILAAGALNPNLVRIALRKISTHAPLVVFFDEFNELADTNAIIGISNTIKTLSDNIERVTLCPVGVAENLDLLLEGHMSAVRAIVQVNMPRMERKELRELVSKGLAKLHMEATPNALTLMEIIPRGFPQYAHLLAQEGARQALLASKWLISRPDVLAGLRVGLKKMDRTLSTAYHNATYSANTNRYADVLLACAICDKGGKEGFSPADIRSAYCRIIGDDVNVDRYNAQLVAMATNRDILVRDGDDRRWRYRFREPLMEPYVILEGLGNERITPEDFPL
jgi:AAA ATPase domain